MTPEDLAALRIAVQSLEHPGLAARLTNMVGKPIELIGDMLPVSAKHAIEIATSKGLEAALKVALRTMQGTPHAGSRLLHKALATASGAAGGAFGLASLPIELPVSTIIMLRSIAEIARSEGEDLSDPESALSLSDTPLRTWSVCGVPYPWRASRFSIFSSPPPWSSFPQQF